MKSWHKTFIIMSYDLFLIVISFFLSFSLRFSEFFPPIFSTPSFGKALAFSIPIQFCCFYLLGPHKAIWRFFGLSDFIVILKGVAFAIFINTLFLLFVVKVEFLPRSTFIINFLLLVFGLGGGRFVYRTISNRKHLVPPSSDNLTKVILIGAGQGGEKIAREVKNDSNFHIIGIVDDDPGKMGKTLHGVEVLGQTKDLPLLALKMSAQKALIAIPSATEEEIRKIVNYCREAKLKTKILPKLSHILQGEVNFSQIRDLGPEDLLGRETIALDVAGMRKMIKGKTLLITGAGGSIGSELCLQVVKLRPKKLILFELTELFLYTLELKLKEYIDNEIEILPIIGDVREPNSLESIFLKYKPEVIFHAAAYKHVPMMEQNPREAVKTNILGTQNIAECALKHGPEKFILISTDKAVNPTNVMGTSKKIAEMIVQCFNEKKQGSTKFIALRFGNVLGSSGSVIPLFKKQIEKGGPITVTHPQVKRYFMTILEASQLIIQAASFGRGGEIFVLDMGKPIYIKDLATEMIQLSGHKKEDIEIIYTGLRSGEKLFEEIVDEKEPLLSTNHPKVKSIQGKSIPDNFLSLLQELREKVFTLEEVELKLFLKKILPEYEIKENKAKGDKYTSVKSGSPLENYTGC